MVGATRSAMRASSPSWRGLSIVKCRKGGPGRPPTSDEVGLEDPGYGPLRQGMQDGCAFRNPAWMALHARTPRSPAAHDARSILGATGFRLCPVSRQARLVIFRPEGARHGEHRPIQRETHHLATARGIALVHIGQMHGEGGGPRKFEDSIPRNPASGALAHGAWPCVIGTSTLSGQFFLAWQGGQRGGRTRLSCAGRTPPPQHPRFPSRPSRPIPPNRRGV